MPKAPKEAKERAQKLRESINRYRYEYHVLNNLSISEGALDSLKDELFKLEGEYPDLITPDSPTQRVAGEPLKEFSKVRHEVSQWSFNDAFSPEDMRDFDLRVKRFLKTAGITKDPSYTCELKIDGLKVVCEYRGGKFFRAATRGDGVTGEDVTLNVKTIESLPLTLLKPVDVIVEGEVYMKKSTLEKLNRERAKNGDELFANPRNVSAGSIRQLDPKIAASRKLDVFFYDLARGEEELPTQRKELEYLRALGFPVNRHFTHVHNIDEVIAFWEKWREKAQKEDYQIDGVVVKVDEREFQESLGYTGKAPRFAIAFKFPAEQVTTIVEDIVLQVGRTGVLTPVAHLKPVLVYGSVVSRATLHNEDEIKRLDVRIGDTVVLQKAGDVIPDIVKVLTEFRSGKEKSFRWPTRVDACGGNGAIERIPGQAAWRCVAKDSYAQLRRKLAHFAGKHAFDIEGLGQKNIDLFLEHELIAAYDDIFTLKRGDLLALPRFAEKSADNLLSGIATRRKIPLPRFLIGLSIPQVGEETAYDIAEAFGALEKIRKSSAEDFQKIYGVGEVVAHSLSDWFKDTHNRALLERLLKQVEIEKMPKKKAVNGAFAGKTVVLTGTLSQMSRDEAKKRVRDLGGEISESVSRKTNFVVAGENPGSKRDKAEEFGIRILEEAEFLRMLSK